MNLTSTDRSRRNARHRAEEMPCAMAERAETVIDGPEESEDYRGFAAAVIADNDARAAVERALVVRLASPLWRMQRVISIETDLPRIKSEIARERRDVDPGSEANKQPDRRGRKS
jgi:hypothetical protein